MTAIDYSVIETRELFTIYKTEVLDYILVFNPHTQSFLPVDTTTSILYNGIPTLLPFVCSFNYIDKLVVDYKYCKVVHYNNNLGYIFVSNKQMPKVGGY